MVPVNFHQFRNELHRVLLDHVGSLSTTWDPFAAAWLIYALSADGVSNNQPLSELIGRMRRWVEEESVWDAHRNIGPVAATLWICEKAHQTLLSQSGIAGALGEKVLHLNAEEKWSPLRDPEQVFLLALGFQAVEGEAVKNHLKGICKREMQRGPLQRRILYAAALKELGEQVACPYGEPQDEGDIVALIWWVERYGGNKHEQWERFGSIQDRIAVNASIAQCSQRILTLPEIAMLYEAVAQETSHPDPMLLFDYYPLHERIRGLARDYFQNGKYAAAVFEATKALNEMIQERSGIRNRYEADLVQTAMKQVSNPSKLPLRFNDFLHEDSGKSEQTGLALICEGIFKAFRNPKGHKPEDHQLVQLTPYEALDQLVVISYLMRRIEQASVQKVKEKD